MYNMVNQRKLNLIVNIQHLYTSDVKRTVKIFRTDDDDDIISDEYYIIITRLTSTT